MKAGAAHTAALCAMSELSWLKGFLEGAFTAEELDEMLPAPEPIGDLQLAALPSTIKTIYDRVSQAHETLAAYLLEV
jgi:hypothetical protein